MRATLLVIAALLSIIRPVRADYFLSYRAGQFPTSELQCKDKRTTDRPLPCGGCSFDEVKAYIASVKDQRGTKDRGSDRSAMVTSPEILFQEIEIEKCRKTPKLKEWCDFMVQMNKFNLQFDKLDRGAITNRRMRIFP